MKLVIKKFVVKKVNFGLTSPTGNGYENKYRQHYDDKGVRTLVLTEDKEPVYKKIQSFAEDTNIYKILSRYFGGDVSVLDKNKGFYADIRDIPCNFNDFHNKIVECQNIWNGLATDFKEMFNNDLNQFVSSIYNKDFEDKLNLYSENKQKGKRLDVQNVVSQSSESEVKSNE